MNCRSGHLHPEENVCLLGSGWSRDSPPIPVPKYYCHGDCAAELAFSSPYCETGEVRKNVAGTSHLHINTLGCTQVTVQDSAQ